jgi:FdhD protein
VSVRTASQLVWERSADGLSRRPDHLAVEEPLEIRVSEKGASRTLTVTMRTPGHDFELVAGWLLAEGAVDSAEDIRAIRYCTDPELDGEQRFNVVTADLAGDVPPVAARRVLSSSSCGVCGTATIDALKRAGHPALLDGQRLDWAVLAGLPAQLRSAQEAFESTGGLHGAALVSFDGEQLVVREDIGRHNAVDKVIGWALLEGHFPLSDTVLVVSGRTSFEIVQKALRAGIPMIAAISAASSLAQRMAEEAGLTLVGFLRGDRCTVYAHPERIGPPGS